MPTDNIIVLVVSHVAVFDQKCQIWQTFTGLRLNNILDDSVELTFWVTWCIPHYSAPYNSHSEEE